MRSQEICKAVLAVPCWTQHHSQTILSPVQRVLCRSWRTLSTKSEVEPADVAALSWSSATALFVVPFALCFYPL
jgi:hypothetical protein